ncbi:LOW QUALITY PROTEIN: uncharacterized protein [Atheta coriaria]|uniref:LOW QUALITY PROTEIN: uncharacterized protein n=1 Tax=Dalotia coriaria TaxID=877792 RepID=UPI0031F3A08A
MDARKNIDPTDTFDENPGIIQRFIQNYSTTDLTSELPPDEPTDPVLIHNYEVQHPLPARPPRVKAEKDPTIIEPSVSTRLGLQPYPPGEVGAKYVAPMPKLAEYKELKKKNRKEFFDQIEFCDHDVLRLPSPIIMDTISKLEEESPHISKAKVLPERPSVFTSSTMVPPTKSQLKAKEIKSGIFLNVDDSDMGSRSSAEEEEIVKKKKKPKKRRVIKRRKHKRQPLPSIQESIHDQGDIDLEQQFMQSLEFYDYEMYGEGGPEIELPIWKPEMYDVSTHVSDNLILGPFADQMSIASSATSMADKSAFDDVSWCEIPLTSRLVQTLRDAQCVKPKKKYRKGCLENHSFTKLKQSILTDFPHCTIIGSINQGDLCFPKVARGNQGICMPIAAFCYAHIKKYKDWTSRSLDEIVELGNCHFMSSIAEIHMHKGRKELAVHEVNNFFFICDKKIKFEISDPEVKGLTRSTDKKIFNISTGLKVFFCNYNTGILRTENLNILIWKIKKGCYLFFDANPRKSNLYQDKVGSAVMTIVSKLKAIRSILLDRSSIGNSPFNICQIKVLKIMGKDEREEDEYTKERNTYIALNDRQAIVQGSFDLGDLCFLFNRNKQSLSMSIVALAYSRISVPHSWHKKTLDKILIIGNQLHSVIVESESCTDVGVEHLPAVFTVGPYVLEIHIYPNRYADLMYKKSNCIFSEDLKLFFESNNNCVAQIGKAYMAIWQQRDMFFCFDPHTRNKEGLKCRQGAAVCSMNKDLDVLLETVVQNYDSRETIFHLHAVKLIRIHRDPVLTKFFPKHLTLQEMPMETFHRHKCMKSKKRATDKPFATADFKEHALKKLLAGITLADSIYDVQSNLGVLVLICYLYLSDTQIVPKRRKELEEEPEGQEGGDYGPVPMYGLGEDIEQYVQEEQSQQYGVMSQVTSGELDPCFRADYINTDLTYCYKLLPAMELPMRTKEDRDIIIDLHQQEKELQNLRYYDKINDEMQILTGKANCFDFIYEEDDPNLIIPYMCIMAAAYDIEKPINRWDDATIGFVLQSGRMLYDQYAESFVHIDDFKFELVKNNIMATIHIIFNTYIGDDLFDTFSGQKILEEFIDRHVFNQQDVGFVMVPHYACAVFFKKSLFYLFDPYNCDKWGNVQPLAKKGRACLIRFRSMDELVKRLIQNLSKRVVENDTCGMQFRMLMLAKPKFTLLDQKPTLEQVQPEDTMTLMRTLSEEFKRPSNYIKLPDGSQLIRGTKHVGDCGVEVEYIAPYICIMAAVVGEKYCLRTWSSDVLDFVMTSGDVLYKKSKYGFVQLVKLELPHIVLGHEDFKCQIRYIFDAPCNLRIMKLALQKVIMCETDWVFIVTEVYTCAVCQRRGIYYLYNPFSCNELGLDDVKGFSSVARFRDMEDLCLRIIFNKTKRDVPEKGNYSRFALYVCRVSRRRKSVIRMKYPGDDMDEDEGHKTEDHEEEAEEEEELVARNKHGYVKVTNVEVIEGTKVLERPASDQVDLMEDHFASLAAALMVIHKPLENWTTKNVDKTIDLGKHIYDHADSLEQSRRRTIRNILVGKYFFDVIVKTIEIEPYKYRKNFKESLKYVMRKRKFIMLQTGEGTYVIYIDTDNHVVHLYHPYQATFNQKDKPSEDVSNACWIKFKSFKQAIKFLKKATMNRYKFFTFNVINVTRAPRSVIVSAMIQDWIRAKQVKGEISGKSFHEHESWMDLHDNPWSRLGGNLSPMKGAHNKWYSWDIEYNNDLYMICGTMSQHDKCFKSDIRGKQTLASLVAVIGMTGIYDLKEWNPSVIDAVLISGYKYFVKCIENIEDKDHEFSMEDLIDECEIFPFQFKVRYQAVVEGTMFLTSTKRFNLYKSLQFFFDEYYYRAGIIVANKNGVKKMVAFAKRKDNEYYMFDCMTFGKPMFAPHEGVAYMLRCTTLARLIHVIVLTLRGGDFYVYEVIADSYSAVEGDMNPYVDEKPKLRP